MNEKEFEDKFYSSEAQHILAAPLLVQAKHRICCFISRHGISSSYDKVLSLGSGIGRIEIQTAPLVGEILGVEISPIAVLEAQEQAISQGATNVHFQIGDVQFLDFPPFSFDAIWALGLLHHLNDEEIIRMLQRSLSWLKPGGLFLSMDPNVHRAIGRFRHFFSEKYRICHSPDERELDIRKIGSTFMAAGFENHHVHYVIFFMEALGWILPGVPKPLAGAIAALDLALVRTPCLKKYASCFAIVARRPGFERTPRNVS